MEILLKNNLKIQQVTLYNHAEIKHLLDQCKDYYLLADGRCATNESVNEIFKYTSKKSPENSLTLGVYDNHNILIGILDVYKNYPQRGIWMIGLLLFSPEGRNKGLGKIVHSELVRYAKDNGATSLRLGVLEENIKGRKFWDLLGYKLEIETNYKSGDKEHKLSILTLNI